MMIKLFALNASRDFGQEVAKLLSVPLSLHEEFRFEDGECYIAPSPKIQENVRGCDVFVIQSIYSDPDESVHEKMMKMLIFMGALKDASVKRITAVLPYYPFARSDRKVQSRAPITTKYVARLFKALWTDRVLALDVHNPVAIQNAHHIPVDLLEATNLFAVYVRSMLHRKSGKFNDIVVLSPDAGGLGRARKFRKVLSEVLHVEVGLACLDKIHVGTEIKGHGIMGDVKDKRVIIYDDMISSGKTVLECVQALKDHDAHSAFAVCASHGLFVGKANEYLEDPFLENIIITDTIKPFRLQNQDVIKKLNIIKTTHLFAEAIKRIHDNDSISDLITNHLDKWSTTDL